MMTSQTSALLLGGYFDEFNTMIAANVDARTLRENGIKAPLWVVSFADFAVCFPELDRVVTVESMVNIRSRSQVGNEDFANVGLMAEAELLARNPSLKRISVGQVSQIRGDEHVYKWQFGQLAKYWAEGSMFEIEGSISDSDSGSLSLMTWFDSSDPVVAVNGRNLEKHSFRNNLLLKEIDSLIKAGFRVANLTMNPPRLDQPSDRYIEVPFFSRSYSATAAIIRRSHGLITIGNAGGVSTHLCIRGNVFVIGSGGWVDNRKFGHAGLSLLEARRKGWATDITIHWRRYRKSAVGSMIARYY